MIRVCGLSLRTFLTMLGIIIGIASVVLALALLVHLIRKARKDPDGMRLWLHPVVAGGPNEAPKPVAGKPAARRNKKR